MNKYTKIRDFYGSRSTAVGSSDIPVLAGLYRNFGSTTLRLWEEKTGRAEPWTGNQRTAWGNKLEGMVLREFIEKRYGEEAAHEFYRAKLRGQSIGSFKTNTECRHPERRYALAHVDLLFDWRDPLDQDDEAGEPYIVEAKTSGFMSGRRKEGQVFRGYDPDDLSAQGIPDAVYLQVQWQLFCYGINTAWVAVLIDTADYREYGPIEADPRVQERCLTLAERFWRLVESGTMPAPETWDDVMHLWPHQADTTAMVSGDDEQRVREMIERNKKLKEQAKAIEDEQDDIKNAIGVLLGENQFLSSAEGQILAKSSEETRESVSMADLRKKAPEIETLLRERELIRSSTFRKLRY